MVHLLVCCFAANSPWFAPQDRFKTRSSIQTERIEKCYRCELLALLPIIRSRAFWDLMRDLVMKVSPGVRPIMRGRTSTYRCDYPASRGRPKRVGAVEFQQVGHHLGAARPRGEEETCRRKTGRRVDQLGQLAMPTAIGDNDPARQAGDAQAS